MTISVNDCEHIYLGIMPSSGEGGTAASPRKEGGEVGTGVPAQKARRTSPNAAAMTTMTAITHPAVMQRMDILRGYWKSQATTGAP